MTKDELRTLLKKHGLKQWQLADALGICEWWLCKKLRYPITAEFEAEILTAVEQLREENR